MENANPSIGEPTNEDNNNNQTLPIPLTQSTPAPTPSSVSTASVHDEKDSKYLVIDTGALIKGVRLERLASHFYTIQEVLNEVRDRQARHFLASFPFEIKVREPTPDALKEGTVYIL